MVRKSFLSILLFLSLNSYGSSFVKTDGINLVEDEKRFVVKGTNQYYLFYKSQKMIDEVIDDAAAMGLNTLRTWGFCDGEVKDNGYCFQPNPRVYHEPTFQKMDYIIYKASQKGIKLVIPFVNNWDAFGGTNQYVRWSPTTNKNHDEFYKDPWSRQLYKDYVSYFLNRVNTITGVRYKDDPTILMWELTNEMRSQSDPSGESLQKWIEEMSSWIKSIDPNHMLSTGMEGFGRGDGRDWLHNDSQGTRYIENHKVKYIDVVAFHLYPDHWGISKEYSLYWIDSSIKIAHEQIGKPVVCGEFGLQNKNERAYVYRDWYRQHNLSEGDGMMFWLLSGKQDDGSFYPDYDGFTVYFPEDKDVVQVIKEGG